MKILSCIISRGLPSSSSSSSSSSFRLRSPAFAPFFSTSLKEKENRRCSPSTLLVSTHSRSSFWLISLNSKPSPFIIAPISSPFSENILASHCTDPLFFIVNPEDKPKRSQHRLGKLEIYGFTFHS